MDVKSSYDIIAKEFKDTRVFTWNWVDKYIKEISNNNYLNILDIGCGNGRFLNYNNNLGKTFNFFHNFYGIDISFMQLKNNTNKSQCIQCNMVNLPFKNSSFNNILCIASFHHLKNNEERLNCLKELKRVLIKNNNSSILLSVWSFNQPNKTKRIFNHYGDNIVNWKMKNNQIIPRYYYIFEINEIKNLLKSVFTIYNHMWDCGNEIFILKLNN